MAFVGLFFAEILNTWFQVDLVFHVAIFVLAAGGIISEKILHRHKHSGVIGE
jgi:general stress protein CsbA